MNVIVLSGYGLNCEEETLFAFQEAGRYLNTNISGKIVHIKELLSNPKQLASFNTMVIPGGFSYGDDTGAGNAYALRLIHGLNEHIRDFMARDTLLLGICNGCQILLRMLCPNVALVSNDVGMYQCRWVTVKASNNSVWLDGIDKMYIPVAHGEGKFYAAEDVLQNLETQGDIALRYVNSDGEYAEGEFPYNPNGSARDIAAITCNSGRALMMMPHPERAIFFTQRYDWTDIVHGHQNTKGAVEKYADGFQIFVNAVRYFS
ncbi:phosphoribosylformylglycinamidine synthase subunit PurQ [Anaplasma phagocytophilum]|uniref:CobB/CobQ-like glutamine amidotransferase domain protein n=3 Tax=Anaplasma phagocytophilum TaxID=948 RepID=A0A0F3NJK1_ANAPH|nr:phosphoribosylformylglycinamidine synthase subunit PurQ [Anaplasma phagocytophilum]KJZ99380.1 cobB/CobQ-like glutamine amidotransferase domain protein [Anaplasma phagocytophilum str. CR1007]ABD43538.1 putative phosphoribosylformylglycinamidine synthase I [Anaplasma phagocytophilum str. HZ]AGR78667.1 phosphoribosylformylglycinamidine synthase [Anaplasma phagocytophilum str. HZ2]KJV59975.1 cobB/CobQ-like glutamine amidotransferase domain protein [Anaplasma phagocytophilum str. Webster]KJV6822